MRYSEMTGQDRLTIFNDPEHYPLLVSVDDNEQPLDKVAVDGLRREGIDFDVDEKQVTLILINKGTC